MIDEIIRKSYDTLSHVEKLHIADYKYQQKQKISYDEYVLMAMENHEVYFCYNATEYQIDYGLPNVVSLSGIKSGRL